MYINVKSLLHVLLQTHTHTLRCNQWPNSDGQCGLFLALCLCHCNVLQVPYSPVCILHVCVCVCVCVCAAVM